MIETDAALAKRNQELIDLINRQFGQPRDGMVYERYLENHHRPDVADLDFLRRARLLSQPDSQGAWRRGTLQGRLLSPYRQHPPARRRGHFADDPGQQQPRHNARLAGPSKRLAQGDRTTPAGELRDELARRREAGELFCRWVASGQISAFALTEPSAGSDTARVGTRAKLRQVPVELDVGKAHCTAKVMVSTASCRLTENRRAACWMPGELAWVGQPAARHIAGPTPQHQRRFISTSTITRPTPPRNAISIADGRHVYFDDIAQLRERDGRALVRLLGADRRQDVDHQRPRHGHHGACTPRPTRASPASSSIATPRA